MRLYFILFCFFLTSCITLLPPAAPPAKKVDLQIKIPDFSFLNSVPWSLAVEEPIAPFPYSHTQIMLNIEKDNLRYLQPCAGLEWSDRLPLLIQQKIIYVFEHSQKVQGVGIIGENFSANRILHLNLHKADIKIKESDSAEDEMLSTQDIETILSISAKVIDQKSTRIIGQKIFNRCVICPEKTKKEFIICFEKALSYFIYDLVKWTLTLEKNFAVKEIKISEKD